jgi:iron complex transport system substrate-binding protein
MTRKLILLFVILVLALSACNATETPTQEPLSPTEAPTDVVAEPDPTATETPQDDLEEPTPYPAPDTGVDESTSVEPTPYPAPQVAASAPTQEAYPGPEGIEEWPHTFVDDLDRRVELAAPAERIITLGPSSLESLFAIGAGEQVVGREEYSTYPDEALEIISVGSLWGELPTEAILALEPDLVIAPEIISPEQIQTLEDLGLTVYFQANPVDFEGLWQNLRSLAAITGHEEEAEDLITTLEARVKTVEEIVAPLSYRPSVFYELDATDPQNPYTIGAGTFIDTIIIMSGGLNIGQALDGGYAPISSEQVISQNPEIILLADAPYGITPESVAARAGWDVIIAVQNEAVYEFDPFLVSVPGPRLVDGLEAMAQLLHPEVFE